MLMAVARKPRMPGRRPTSREMVSESRAGLGAAFALIALVAIVELMDGAQPHYIGVLAAAPVLAAALAPWRQVLAVGVVGTVIGAAFSVPDASNPRQMLSDFVSVAFIVLGTGIAAVVGAYRQRQAERFVELSKLASAAQGAVLRPLGPQLGQLSIAARYSSAMCGARGWTRYAWPASSSGHTGMSRTSGPTCARSSPTSTGRWPAASVTRTSSPRRWWRSAAGR
jgi:hypothetical protein